MQQVVKTREGDVVLQLCNNAKCRRREDRPFQFERCSQCQAAFYCGPLCQEEDWFVGHHWRRCKAPKPGAQPSKFSRETFSPLLLSQVPCRISLFADYDKVARTPSKSEQLILPRNLWAVFIQFGVLFMNTVFTQSQVFSWRLWKTFGWHHEIIRTLQCRV